MLLRRFIEPLRAARAQRGLLLFACASVLVGCASAPRSGDDSVDTGAQAGAADAATQPEVPSAVRTLYERAVSAMAAGDPGEAELRFKEFVLQYPDYPGAYVNLAILEAGNGDDKAAEENIARALALQPEQPAALNQLGMLRRRQGRFEEAEAAYLKAVTAAPDYALAHYNLGVLNELYLQRLDVALQQFERFEELGGADEEVAKWIVDLRRRVTATERTANAKE